MGRLSTSWSSDLLKVTDNYWMRAAQDRFLERPIFSSGRLSTEMMMIDNLETSYSVQLQKKLSSIKSKE